MLRRRLEEIESELTRSRDGKENENRDIIVSSSTEGNSFVTCNCWSFICGCHLKWKVLIPEVTLNLVSCMLD